MSVQKEYFFLQSVYLDYTRKNP